MSDAAIVGNNAIEGNDSPNDNATTTVTVFSRGFGRMLSYGTWCHIRPMFEGRPIPTLPLFSIRIGDRVASRRWGDGFGGAWGWCWRGGGFFTGYSLSWEVLEIRGALGRLEPSPPTPRSFLTIPNYWPPVKKGLRSIIFQIRKKCNQKGFITDIGGGGYHTLTHPEIQI